MKRLFRVTFWLLTIGALNLSCASDEDKLTIKEVIRPVRTLKVFATGGDRIRKFSGITQAAVEAKLSFKVAGTVSNLNARIGKKVKEDQVLAILEAKDFKLQVQQAQASHAQAKAQERNAKNTYDRTRRLYENKTASRSDLDAARAAYDSSKAAVDSIANQIELLRRQLSYTRLISPVDGVISKLLVEVNENVQAGKVVLHLSSESLLEVKFTVPEVFISQLHYGDKVMVKFDAMPRRDFEGTITEVGVTSEVAGATYPVVVTLNKSLDDIRPGMAAEVKINFSGKSEPEKYVVPSVAVSQDRESRFVYIVEESPNEKGYGLIKKRKVKTGDLSSEGLEITSGLKDGELLVTAGVSRIREGLKVRLMDGN